MIMSRILIVIWLIIPSVYLFAQHNHVLFGERTLNDTRHAIYFDQDGSIYPDYFISNASLDSCNSSLINWYGKHLPDFLNISRKYGCLFIEINPANITTLNDSIISSYQKKFNKSRQHYS